MEDQCRKLFFVNADVVHVARFSSSVSIATEANAIAAPPAANEYGGSRGVQPINGTREPNVVGKPIAHANETTVCARLGLA